MDDKGRVVLDQRQVLLSDTLRQVDQNHIQLLAKGINQNYFTQIVGTEITMALVLISFITFLIAGNV